MRKEDGRITGPMSPVEAAKNICKQLGETFSVLSRVSFDDPEVNNQYEDRRSLTGYDTLLIGTNYKDGQRDLRMFVDMGCRALPVALMLSDDTEPTVTPIYRNSPMAKKLSNARLREIMRHCFQEWDDVMAVREPLKRPGYYA